MHNTERTYSWDVFHPLYVFCYLNSQTGQFLNGKLDDWFKFVFVGSHKTGRSVGGVSCKDQKVTGQIQCACVLMRMCVLEEEKRENKRERKREREVWYHQLNNPPTQHLVLSLRPSVSFPAADFLLRFFFLFLSCGSISPLCFPAWTRRLAWVTECSFSLFEHCIFHPSQKNSQVTLDGGGNGGKGKRVNVTKGKSAKRKTHWPHINQPDVHTFMMLLINS